jgi:hypothetical protein
MRKARIFCFGWSGYRLGYFREVLDFGEENVEVFLGDGGVGEALYFFVNGG